VEVVGQQLIPHALLLQIKDWLELQVEEEVFAPGLQVLEILLVVQLSIQMLVLQSLDIV